MADDPLTTAQQRTAAARAALAATFPTPEAKRAYYTRIGRQGNAGRITLSGAQAQLLAEHAATLADAYQFLREITARVSTRASPETAPVPDHATFDDFDKTVIRTRLDPETGELATENSSAPRPRQAARM